VGELARALRLRLQVYIRVLQTNQYVLLALIGTIKMEHLDLGVHEGLASDAILSELALLLFNRVNFTVQRVNFDFLFDQAFSQLVFRIKVVLNELVQVDVTVVVLVAFPEDFVHDLRSVRNVHVFHLQEIKHFRFVDASVTI
jgi:hypothetical protein